MTDKDLNRRQGYIESDHEEKNSLQQRRRKCQFSKNILDIRYEDLRRKVIETKENNPLSPFTPFSQELLIFIQQGMIDWVEEWSKYHPINPIDVDMTGNHKIKESDFIGIDNNSDIDSNNPMAGIKDTGCTYSNSSLHLSMDLQAQIKNLLTHMAISTIPLSANL